jgi:hypothetical protein
MSLTTSRKIVHGPPILIGYESQITLPFSAKVIANYPLATGRILAHFKNQLSDIVPLFILDSDVTPLTFTRTPLVAPDENAGGLSLQLNLTEINTALITKSTVTFDLVHIVSGVRRLLPVRFTWGVRLPVTRRLP